MLISHRAAQRCLHAEHVLEQPAVSSSATSLHKTAHALRMSVNMQHFFSSVTCEFNTLRVSCTTALAKAQGTAMTWAVSENQWKCALAVLECPMDSYLQKLPFERDVGPARHRTSSASRARDLQRSRTTKFKQASGRWGQRVIQTKSVWRFFSKAAMYFSDGEGRMGNQVSQ